MTNRWLERKLTTQEPTMVVIFSWQPFPWLSVLGRLTTKIMHSGAAAWQEKHGQNLLFLHLYPHFSTIHLTKYCIALNLVLIWLNVRSYSKKEQLLYGDLYGGAVRQALHYALFLWSRG